MAAEDEKVSGVGAIWQEREMTNVLQLRDIPFFVFMISLLCLLPEPACAYLDPSTGSYAIQCGLGTLFALVFNSRRLWGCAQSYFYSIVRK